MKICFVLQRRWAFMGNYLAKILRDNYRDTEFCGYAFLRSSYNWLREQTDVRYTNLILDEDIHEEYKKEPLDIEYIKWLERECGRPYLWPYLAVDRILMFNQLVREYPYDTPKYSHEEMLRVLQVSAKRLIAFLDKEKPDCVVFSVVGSVGAMLLYYLAKKRGIKTLNIITTSLKDRFAVSERYDTLDWADEQFKQNLANGRRGARYEEAKAYLYGFRENPHPYDAEVTPARQPLLRTQQFSFLLPAKFIHSLRWFGHILFEHVTTPYRRDYSYIHPWHYLVDHARRKLRNLAGMSGFYDHFDPAENFAYFPLHYEPEVSLLLQAPFATDQIHVIEQIARSLPVSFKLYVKEHPLMAIYRPRAYYRRLKKIPNVKLIDPTKPSWKIIPHAKLIATITGSSGWEGLLLKKPVICFGDQYYNALSMVKRCRSYEELAGIVQQQLEHFHYNEEELLQYIASALEDTAELPLSYLWEQETNEEKKKQALAPLADLLARKIGLSTINSSPINGGQ